MDKPMLPLLSYVLLMKGHFSFWHAVIVCLTSFPLKKGRCITWQTHPIAAQCFCSNADEMHAQVIHRKFACECTNFSCRISVQFRHHQAYSLVVHYTTPCWNLKYCPVDTFHVYADMWLNQQRAPWRKWRKLLSVKRNLRTSVTTFDASLKSSVTIKAYISLWWQFIGNSTTGITEVALSRNRWNLECLVIHRQVWFRHQTLPLISSFESTFMD